MKAWHFVNEDMRLCYGDNRKVVIGKTLSHNGPVELCRSGMHGSKRVIDALKYAKSPILTRVEITGGIIEGDDKLVGRNRKVLWMLDASDILHEFSALVAMEACKNAGITDERVLSAPKAKIDWLAGKISDAELDAARSAAWSAVSSAVRSAVRSAVSSAVWSAAWSVARSAVWSAAWSAAGSAARSAAWSAAESAAWSAARSDQETLIQKLISNTEWY